MMLSWISEYAGLLFFVTAIAWLFLSFVVPAWRQKKCGREVLGKFPSTTTVFKPWGNELIWANQPKYVGKILHIEKGHSLSKQYHEVKDETIMVLSGQIRLELEYEGITLDVTLRDGGSYHISPGVIHRMVAIKTTDVLEVSTPELDDVVRLEDKYGRV